MNLLDQLPTLIGAAAVAPALLALWLVIAAEESPVPPLRVWAAFLLGAASISLLGLARAPFAALLTLSETPWVEIAVRALFGIAAPEEIVKILVILAVSVRRPPLSDPMDSVVYGAAAGLGFAAYENLIYLHQYPDMWKSLAVMRSVLTVPLHGALGIIAGAYIAISRSGGALGAHRGGRDIARIRALALIVLAPVMLHAAFDAPLLTLQYNPDMGSALTLILESTGLLVGFGTIGLAARLVRRIGRHHAPRSDLSRARLAHLRGMWALLVAGGGAGFAGTAFVLANLRDYMADPDRNMKLVAIPLGFGSIAVGVILIGLATSSYVQTRNRLHVAAPRPPSAGRRAGF